MISLTICTYLFKSGDTKHSMCYGCMFGSRLHIQIFSNKEYYSMKNLCVYVLREICIFQCTYSLLCIATQSLRNAYFFEFSSVGSGVPKNRGTGSLHISETLWNDYCVISWYKWMHETYIHITKYTSSSMALVSTRLFSKLKQRFSEAFIRYFISPATDWAKNKLVQWEKTGEKFMKKYGKSIWSDFEQQKKVAVSFKYMNRWKTTKRRVE